MPKKTRIAPATTQSFDLSDGDLTKEDLRAMGITIPINRGQPARYYVKSGRVYMDRGHKGCEMTSVFCYGVHPLKSIADWVDNFGKPIGYWDGIGEKSLSTVV